MIAYVKKCGRRWLFELLIVIGVFLAIDQWRATGLLNKEAALPLTSLPLLKKGTELAVPVSGKVLLYFFAPWCHVCKLSMGNLAQLQQQFPTLSVQLIALDYNNVSQVEAFIGKKSLNFPVLLGNEKTRDEWNISMYPSYYILENNKIVAKSVGYSTELGMKLRLMLADN